MASIEKTELVPLLGQAGKTWGGCLFMTDGTKVYLPDIHPDPARAAAFLGRVLGEEADETQLRYYLEDFLAEQ